MSMLVPQVSPLSRREIEAIAETFLRRHFPERLMVPGPLDVISLFEDVIPTAYPHLKTGVAELPRGAEGMAWPDGRIEVSEETYRNACNHQGRARFTIPHECFHGIQHSRQLKTALVHTGTVSLYRRTALKPFLDPEWQANTFASAILMPASAVILLADKTNPFELCMRMTRVFRVSHRAAEVRLDVLQDLGKL